MNELIAIDEKLPVQVQKPSQSYRSLKAVWVIWVTCVLSEEPWSSLAWIGALVPFAPCCCAPRSHRRLPRCRCGHHGASPSPGRSLHSPALLPRGLPALPQPPRCPPDVLTLSPFLGGSLLSAANRTILCPAPFFLHLSSGLRSSSVWPPGEVSGPRMAGGDPWATVSRPYALVWPL